MQAVINVFAVMTILGALFSGAAVALRKLHENKLATDFEKIVDRGFLRPFDWIEMFGEMITTNLVVKQFPRVFIYGSLSGLSLTSPLLGEVEYPIVFWLSFPVLIWLVVKTYRRESTMRRVFHQEKQS